MYFKRKHVGSWVTSDSDKIKSAKQTTCARNKERLVWNEDEEKVERINSNTVFFGFECDWTPGPYINERRNDWFCQGKADDAVECNDVPLQLDKQEYDVEACLKDRNMRCGLCKHAYGSARKFWLLFAHDKGHFMSEEVKYAKPTGLTTSSYHAVELYACAKQGVQDLGCNAK